jgi:hypothetical protein
MSYQDKLKSPKWQRKRLEVLNRDDWKCVYCDNSSDTLHVHHKSYEHGRDPWEYEMDNFLTLCESCHKVDHEYRYESEKTLLDCLKSHNFSCDNITDLTIFIESMFSSGMFPTPHDFNFFLIESHLKNYLDPIKEVSEHLKKPTS